MSPDPRQVAETKAWLDSNVCCFPENREADLTHVTYMLIKPYVQEDRLLQ